MSIHTPEIVELVNDTLNRTTNKIIEWYDQHDHHEHTQHQTVGLLFDIIEKQVLDVTDVSIKEYKDFYERESLCEYFMENDDLDGILNYVEACNYVTCLLETHETFDEIECVIECDYDCFRNLDD